MLGIEFDSQAMVLRLPADKLQSLLAEWHTRCSGGGIRVRGRHHAAREQGETSWPLFPAPLSRPAGTDAEVQDSPLAPTTVRAYTSARYTEFCLATNLPTLPLNQSGLCRYSAWLAAQIYHYIDAGTLGLVPFSVSNGVRQGSVTFFLFSLMVCWLICEILVLAVTGVVPLLERSVMLMMLYCGSLCLCNVRDCCSFSDSYKLEFNASKTQLICFYAPSVRPITPTISLNGSKLSYTDKVVHLGHLFTSIYFGRYRGYNEGCQGYKWKSKLTSMFLSLC